MMSQDDEKLAAELQGLSDAQKAIDAIAERFRRDHPDKVRDVQRGDRLYG